MNHCTNYRDVNNDLHHFLGGALYNIYSIAVYSSFTTPLYLIPETRTKITSPLPRQATEELSSNLTNEGE